MSTGTVKWFSPDKGFGFIAPDDGNEDRFVHRTGLADAYAADLAEGDKVTFEIGDSQRGPVATDVRVTERSGLPARPRSDSRPAPRFGSYDRDDSSGYGSSPRPSARTSVSEEELAAAPVARGTVKRYDTEKGFGFISPESGDDVFVHHTAVTGLPIRPGDLVEFRAISGPRGLRAEQVQLVS